MGKLKKERKADFYACINFLKKDHNPRLKVNCTIWLRVKSNVYDNMTAFQIADHIGQDGWREVYYSLRRWRV